MLRSAPAISLREGRMAAGSAAELRRRFAPGQGNTPVPTEAQGHPSAPNPCPAVLRRCFWWQVLLLHRQTDQLSLPKLPLRRRWLLQRAGNLPAQRQRSAGPHPDLCIR